MRLQVVTDIDDTVKSSGGVEVAGIYLGGVDASYTRGTFYPGVFAFSAELAMAKNGRTPSDVAVLTARAEEFRFALELKQSDKLCVGFRNAGMARGLSDWGVGPVLYGSVAEWICQERKGWRKYENFKLLRERNRKGTTYVFIGDNGKSEKDLEAATRIVEEFPEEVEAVFIHAVDADEQPAPLPDDTQVGTVPVRYFRTYASAAAKAARLGLLDNGAAGRVLDDVEYGLSANPSGDCAPGSTNERVILEDLAEARAALGGGSGWLRGFSQPLSTPLRRLRRAFRSDDGQ
jgi:hypothetical protein